MSAQPDVAPPPLRSKGSHAFARGSLSEPQKAAAAQAPLPKGKLGALGAKADAPAEAGPAPTDEASRQPAADGAPAAESVPGATAAAGADLSAAADPAAQAAEGATDAASAAKPAAAPDDPVSLRTAEGRKVYSGIAADKRRMATFRQIGSWTLAVLAVPLLLVAVTGWLPAAWPLLGVVVVALVFVRVGRSHQWSEHDYYQLPFTRFANRRHRCAHCGRGGVSLTRRMLGAVAHCTSCGRYLWTS